MNILTLRYPVRTFDNQLLLPANSELSEETLDVLISSSRAKSYQRQSLLHYGSIKVDLLNFLNSPHYITIFNSQKKISDILKLLESVHLVLPVLQSIDYFRYHDYYTYRHILNVFALSTLLAKDMISDYQELIQEASSGPVHDIGKICIPLHILKKSKPLTITELSALTHHPVAGYVLLCYYLQENQNLSAIVARDHHERRDGSGYPRGISLMDQMVEIVAVSDIYDALISPRPYRPTAYDNRTALEEITTMAERSKVGWNVVQALVAHNRKAKPFCSDCKVSKEERGTPPQNNVYGVISDEKNQHTDGDDN